MATIKSFTSPEQSRKLAEFLPHESADMAYWKKSYRPNDYAIMAHHSKELQEGFEAKGMEYIPCWSLAALLDVLPNNEHIGTSVSRGSWQIEPINYLPNIWWCEYEDNESLTEFNISADNPVDACYEMIIKLNELNLL